MDMHDGNRRDAYAEADMFDLSGFVTLFTGAIRHHRRLILVTCALTLLAAIVYAVVWPPVYRVQAQLMAERELDPARDVFYANWQVFRKADTRDEVVLFTSGPVLREVIERNDLTYDDVYHPFLSHAGYLARQSWVGRAYRSVKNWIFPDPDPVTPEEEDRGRTLDGLTAGVSIAGEQDSNVATVTVKGPSPRVAEIANSIIDTYLEYRTEQFKSEAQTAFDVLSEEAESARAELDEIVARREAFAKEHGLLVEFQKETQDIGALTQVESRAADLQSQISSLRASLDEVEAQLREEDPETVLSSVRELNPVREDAKLRYLDVQTRLINLRSRYREDSPEVQDAVAELEQLQAVIDSEPEHIDRSVTAGINSNYQQLTQSRDKLSSDLEGVQAALESTEQTASEMRSRLSTLPTVMETATALNREYGVASEKYQRLLLRRMEAQVSATSTDAAPASVRVVDYASVPTGKYWPRMKFLLPGALLFGLTLGTLAAVLRSLTAGRLLRSHMHQGRVGAPVFATIALGDRAPKLIARAPMRGARALAPSEPPSLPTDTYGDLPPGRGTDG